MRALASLAFRSVFAGLVLTSLAACGTTARSRPVVGLSDDTATRSGGTLYGDFLVASYAGQSRDTRVAAARYRAALAADPTSAALLERAFVFSVAAGDMREAAALAPRVAAANPASDLAPLIQGVLALKDRNYRAARGHFTANQPAQGMDLTAALALAWAEAGAGDAAAARAILAEASDPALEAFLAYHRARLEEMLKNVAGADAAYADADRLTGGRSLTIALGYAAWLRSTDRAADARGVLERFLAGDPVNPVATFALQKLEAGEPFRPRVTTAQQGAAEAFYGVASAVGDGEAEDAAIVYLRLALYLDPQNDAALAFLGGALERAGRKREAVEAYRATPRDSAFYLTAQVSAADLLNGLGDEAEAVAILSRLEREESRNGLAASALGDIHRAHERWSEAEAAYTRALRRAGPPYAAADWPLFYARGVSLERQRRWDEAERDFRQALQLSPDQPLVLNYLAYSWVERGRNIEEALDMLHRAVAQRPDDGFVIDSLGWAYYRLGRYREAVDTLEQAIMFSPYEATINEHMGDAYWKVGRRREAGFLWGHALRLKPEADRVPVLEAKLTGGLDAGDALERREARNGPSRGAVQP